MIRRAADRQAVNTQELTQRRPGIRILHQSINQSMHVLHEPISVGYSDFSDPTYHYYIKVPVTNESRGLSFFYFLEDDD